MRHTQTLLLSLFLCIIGINTQAQTDSTTRPQRDSNKKGWILSIGGDYGGVYVGPKSVDSLNKEKFLVTYGMLDLGFNRFDDKTNYNSPSNLTDPFYNGSGVATVPPTPGAFKLNEGKSINVNVWIANTRLKIAGGRNQKLFFTSGIGLQMYNFRFDSKVMYKSDPNTHLETIPADLDVQKNKLGFTYAAIPIGLLAKTRITRSRWLVYGATVTGGYRLASWTKLKTAQHGKEKNHDPFNFSDFNACVMAEVGIDNVFRLYGSYQLTPLSSGPLNQHPFALGVRFFGL